MGSAADELETEEGRLFSWRLKQFEHLGYPTSDAAELALSDADLHKVADLIREGCDRDLARQIVV